MEGIAARGRQVTCLCMAGVKVRPGVSWGCDQQAPYKRYTVFNAGVYPALYSQGGVGSRRPLRDVHASSVLRQAVLEIVRAERPEVASIQSLFGLPFDLVDAIRHEGIPVAFTAHDYFALCPSAHLFLPEEQPCRLSEAELTCHKCCERSPSYQAFWLACQLDRLASGFDSRPFVRTTIWRLRNAVKRVDGLMPRPENSTAYSARRREAVEFLKRLDILHCISPHQARVFEEICGPLANIHVLPLMPPTIENLKAVPRSANGNQHTSFVALNINGAYKGAKLMANAFRTLAGSDVRYELHVYGNNIPGPELRQVSYHGRYQSSDLDRIAAQADFCIVPSVWDETLGFAGLEMLARGVPLVASARAGVGDFIQDGRNGLLFDPASADSLCAAIKKAMNPSCPVRRGCAPAGEFPLRSFSGHVQDMENLFLAAARNRPEPTAAALCG